MGTAIQISNKRNNRWIVKRNPTLTTSIPDKKATRKQKGQQANVFNQSAIKLLNNGEPKCVNCNYAIVTYDSINRCIKFSPICNDKLVDVVCINDRHIGLITMFRRLKEYYGVKVNNGVKLVGKWNDLEECLEIELDENVATFKG